jgi:acyl-CoA reductase-like NAD-dependent aldehyde dehydrogenase
MEAERMNYIAGHWVSCTGDRTYERENPAAPARLIGQFPDSTPADAHRAAVSASDAFPEWSELPANARSEVIAAAAGLLRERQDKIAAVLTAEEGKPLTRARGEVGRAAEALSYFALSALRPSGETLPSTRPGVALSVRAEPIGPFLAITPFNFPVFVTALKLGPALASGNTVVWKPSPFTPLTSIAVIEAFADAGLPPGALNLVMGGSAELGQSLVDEPEIAGISFTGSTAVGLDVGRRAAARHARVQQEMGGKNVLAVAPDCDVRRAAEIACESSFGESGQKCTAASLVVVDKRCGDTFLAEVDAVMSRMNVGDGAEPGTDIGPLVDQRALGRANELIGRATREGAIIELEGCGNSSGTDQGGYFFAPVVARLPAGDNVLKRQETFAPIMALVLADDVLTESVTLVRDSHMGLSASILTDSLPVAHEFARRIPAGLVSINLPTTGVEYQAPFGGWNYSGGPFPEAGPRACEFYTRTKTVAVCDGA